MPELFRAFLLLFIVMSLCLWYMKLKAIVGDTFVAIMLYDLIDCTSPRPVWCRIVLNTCCVQNSESLLKLWYFGERNVVVWFHLKPPNSILKKKKIKQRPYFGTASKTKTVRIMEWEGNKQKRGQLMTSEDYCSKEKKKNHLSDSKNKKLKENQRERSLRLWQPFFYSAIALNAANWWNRWAAAATTVSLSHTVLARLNKILICIRKKERKLFLTIQFRSPKGKSKCSPEAEAV